MAITHRPPEVVFWWPDSAALDPADVVLAYNPFADELAVAFGGRIRPAIIDPLDWTPDDYVALRLDPDTDEVVGIQLDHARRIAAAEHPAWSAVIDVVAVDPELGPRRADRAVWPALTAFIADVIRLSQS